MALRGADSFAASRPNRIISGVTLDTTHMHRGRKRHDARMRQFADMKEELRRELRSEIHVVISDYLQYSDAGRLATQEVIARTALAQQAGVCFSHAHQAYAWARGQDPSLANSFRQLARDRNKAIHSCVSPEVRTANFKPDQSAERVDNAGMKTNHADDVWCFLEGMALSSCASNAGPYVLPVESPLLSEDGAFAVEVGSGDAMDMDLDLMTDAKNHAKHWDELHKKIQRFERKYHEDIYELFSNKDVGFAALLMRSHQVFLRELRAARSEARLGRYKGCLDLMANLSVDDSERLATALADRHLGKYGPDKILPRFLVGVRSFSRQIDAVRASEQQAVSAVITYFEAQDLNEDFLRCTIEAAVT